MRVKTVVLIGAAVSVGVGLVLSQGALSHYEEPPYEVVFKDGNFEIRKYAELISAEVVVPYNSNADNQSFKILAGYIFGNNRDKEKIAMTIPVTMDKQSVAGMLEEHSGNAVADSAGNLSSKIAMTVPVTSEKLEAGMRMRFFMPSKFDLTSLPEPLDKRIRLIKVPPQTYAVVKFSGWLTKGNAEEHEARLQDFMRKHAYRPAGDAITSAYNPPWALPFLRRNEVWIPM